MSVIRQLKELQEKHNSLDVPVKDSKEKDKHDDCRIDNSG
jgi:hypothetical protein